MKRLRIRPEKQGLQVTLFDLEAEIMEIVWSHGWDRFSVSQVHEQLEARREIAYTTVMTTIKRLFDKELLDRERDGRRFLYVPRMSRGEFVRDTARSVLSSLPAMGREEAVALLVEQVGEAEIDELDRLEALIRARREELEG